MANTITVRCPTVHSHKEHEQARILNLLGCYYPGNEATGPVQSFRAMASALNDAFSFSVVSKYPIAGKVSDLARKGWNSDGYCSVRHCTTTPFGAAGLANILNTHTHDLLLLNGFFDRQFTLPALIMRKAGMVPCLPTILSPRGEFAAAALAIGATKKTAYTLFANMLGLLKDVWIHSTAPHETQDVMRSGLQCRGIVEAPDARILHPLPAADKAGLHLERENALRIVYVGRIVPMKNLLFVLRVLKRITNKVRLVIYGPVCDREYWLKCRAAITALPSNVTVDYRGTIASEKIPGALAAGDLFFLPTLGENFGHAIHEALCSGVPVLISDRTPWCDLEENLAGWSIPLSKHSQFEEIINMLATMGSQQKRKLREATRKYAVKMHRTNNAAERTATMFREVMEASR